MGSAEHTRRQFFQALRDRPLNVLGAEERKLYVKLHEDAHDPIAGPAGLKLALRGDRGFRAEVRTQLDKRVTELCYLNGGLWHDVHPLVKEYVLSSRSSSNPPPA